MSVVIDHSLPPKTMVIDGDPEVGRTLRARLSADLEGLDLEWGWHRCNAVPFCQTIRGAEKPTYRPTERDAWQVLRVIAVAEENGKLRASANTVIGPIVDRSPEPFLQSVSSIPSGTGPIFIVGPGTVKIHVTAPCPVMVGAGVSTATTKNPITTAQVVRETPAKTHDLELVSQGGELRLIALGECKVSYSVSGSR